MAYAWDLTFYTTSTPDAASLRERDGTATASQPAFTLVDQGNNWWTCYTSAMPDGHQGCVRVTASGTTVSLGLVAPRETENADVKSSTLQTAVDDVDGYSLEEAMKLILAALAGKISGAPTGPILIRAADDSKVRVTASVTTAGNRTSVTLDAAG
jgi:hypothetical protein